MLPSDPREKKTVKRPVGRPTGKAPAGKRLLESARQAQTDDEENFQVARVHLSVDGEEPTSVKSIRCQYSLKQKQLVVRYARHHRVHPTKRNFGVP